MKCRRGGILSLSLVVVGICLGFPQGVFGHETSMAVLALKEQQQGQFLVRWLLSPGPDARLQPIFPDHCSPDLPRLDCGQRGLTGLLGFEGLGGKHSATVVRVTRQDGATSSYTLTAAQPTAMLAADGVAAWTQVARAYVSIGIEHILLGVDHLLFVLGLIWIVRSGWMLLKTITAFTVAHSITLAAATLEWVSVPERAVNAAIALSILFIGVEIIKVQRGEGGLTARYPWLVAFAFGLLHGFGFADALTKLGLPASSIPLALFSFNVGVELGQIAFVLLVLALQWSHRGLDARLPRWSEPFPAYAIGSLAMFWFIERVCVYLPT